ncbi:MAG TPA: class I SAM-dependent methyltransferase [Candidatus Binatia bacterium]|nr:class I SAM-dependent methyltransferase [Candidatus Binatia bacterium]
MPKGRALDIATGKGRHAVFLAERGFKVVGIDISPVALNTARRIAREKSLAIDWQEADLEQIELPKNHYDLVLNFDYLQRSLVPQIKQTLKPHGWVIFETYLIDQKTIGHPSNPSYLLGHNELLDLFGDFRVLYYREGHFSSREKPHSSPGSWRKRTAARTSFIVHQITQLPRSRPPQVQGLTGSRAAGSSSS